MRIILKGEYIYEQTVHNSTRVGGDYGHKPRQSASEDLRVYLLNNLIGGNGVQVYSWLYNAVCETFFNVLFLYKPVHCTLNVRNRTD